MFFFYENKIRLDFVIDEGGAIGLDVVPGTTKPVCMIAVGEKQSVNFELVTTGGGGHSSQPPPKGGSIYICYDLIPPTNSEFGT